MWEAEADDSGVRKGGQTDAKEGGRRQNKQGKLKRHEVPVVGPAQHWLQNTQA